MNFQGNSIIDVKRGFVSFESLLEQVEDDDDEFDEELSAVHTFSKSEYLDFLSERSQTKFGKAWQSFRDMALSVSRKYSRGFSVTDRDFVRNVVSECRFVIIFLPRIIEEQTLLIREESDWDVAREVLGLVSMLSDNWSNQCRLVPLDNLFHSCVSAFGIERTKELFRATAALSDDVTKEALAAFEPANFESWTCEF